MHKIKQMRLQAGMSQSQLAEKSGISVRVLQNYEAEGTAHRDFDCANLSTILRVCIALGCSLENIIESAETINLLKKVSEVN